MPNLYEADIEGLFEIEKTNIQKKSANPIKFSVLKKSPTEIIYTFTHPQDHLQATGLVRILLSNQG
jgi:hypothetical protein